MSQLAMVVDYGYCVNCYSCEISCAKKNDIPAEEWGIKVTEFGPKKFGDVWEWDYLPVPSRLCNLCEDRIAEGKKAMCELHCVANVIEIVNIEEVPARLKELGPKSACFVPSEVEVF